MLNKQNGFGLLVTLVVLLVIGVAGYVGWTMYTKNKATKVTSFEQCAAAKDSMILEIYPEQCVVNGDKFTNPNQSLIKTQ